jgi:hypothetical protein
VSCPTRLAARLARPVALTLTGAAACGLTLYILGWRPPAPPPPPPEPEPAPVTVVRDAGSWYVTAVGTVVSATEPQNSRYTADLRCGDCFVMCVFPNAAAGPAKLAGPVVVGDTVVVQGVLVGGPPERLCLRDCILLARAPGAPPKFHDPGPKPPTQPIRRGPITPDS